MRRWDTGKESNYQELETTTSACNTQETKTGRTETYTKDKGKKQQQKTRTTSFNYIYPPEQSPSCVLGPSS